MVKFLVTFYKAIRERCIKNPKYQVILLTDNEENTLQLFWLPDNMTVYRLMNLSVILPLCDVALITGDLNTMIEGIYAKIPTVMYSWSTKEENECYIKQYVKEGLALGVCSVAKEITPNILEQQISQVIQHKTGMRERLQKARNAFEDENSKLEQIIHTLYQYIH